MYACVWSKTLLKNSTLHKMQNLVWTEDESKLWLIPSAKQRRGLFWVPPVYPDLSTCHDWPVKNAIVPLPIRMNGNSKRTSGNSLNPLEAQNKDLGTASRTILTEGKLRLPRRLIALKLQQNRRSCRATKSAKKWQV